MSDAITRMEGEANNNVKNHKIGLNILKQNQGLYSLEAIVDNQLNLTLKDKNKAKLKNNIFIKHLNGVELYLITEELTCIIANDIHLHYNHPGVRKTHMIFRENYYCKNDLSIIKNLIVKCKSCQFCKNRNYKSYNLPKSIIATKPLEIVAIDFISDLVPTSTVGKHILVMVDLFSKFTVLYACSRTNKDVVKRHLTEFIEEHGKFEKLIMDNATYFRNENLIGWLQKKDIRPVFTSIRHPKSNFSERIIKEILKQLRLLISSNHSKWQEKLGEVEAYINNVPSLSTDIAPIVLFKNTEPTRRWVGNYNYEELINKTKLKLSKNALKYKNRTEMPQKKHITFKKGDLVLIKHLRVPNSKNNICKKLQPYLEGPYEVNTENGINSY